MTSNSSSTNSRQSAMQQAGRAHSADGGVRTGSLLRHACGRYWYLAVISLVVYFLVGPIATLLKLSAVTRPGHYGDSITGKPLLSRQLADVAEWFSSDSWIFLAFSAVVLAAVIGCVMFFYLQQRRQVNFYHSQPVRRTRLFTVQYLCGLLLNLLPLFLMTAISFLLPVAYGFGAALDIGAIFSHLGYLLLFTVASYSIAVFSGQLTGTVPTQIVLNCLLQFCVPLAALLFQLMSEMFFSTYTGSSLLSAAVWYSPCCAAVCLWMEMGTNLPRAAVMQGVPFETGMVLAQLGISLLGTAASLILYKKRPGEATGRALVYPVSEPILKFYLMLIVSIAAGIVFFGIGNNFFFYFAVIAFALLTHMACEVIIWHDFRAMLRRMPQCAVLLVLVLLTVGIFRFDLIGFDRYLPQPEKVAEVVLTMPGEALLNEEAAFSDDAEVKDAVYAILEPVVEGELYQNSKFEGENSEVDSNRGSTKISMNVLYHLQNGRSVARIYRDVPIEAVQEGYQKLYDETSYKEAYFRQLLQMTMENVTTMDVQDKMQQVQIYPLQSRAVGGSAEREEIAAQILQAYQQDLRDRSFDALLHGGAYSLGIQSTIPSVRGSKYVNMCVYPEDQRTITLLEAYSLIPPVVRGYDTALVFRADVPEGEYAIPYYGKLFEEVTDALLSSGDRQQDTGKETAVSVNVEPSTHSVNVRYEAGRAISAEDYIRALEGKAELTGRVDGEEAVDALIREARVFGETGEFSQMDRAHFLLLRQQSGEEVTWSYYPFFDGALPAQYR